MTALLIEDNRDIRENLCEMLQLEGYNVIVAENGQKGLDFAKEKKPDIILCDIAMPILNGYDVLKTLKSDKEISSIPFIFISASTEKKDIEVGLKMGADAYIQKPFEEHELFKTLTKFIKK